MWAAFPTVPARWNLSITTPTGHLHPTSATNRAGTAQQAPDLRIAAPQGCQSCPRISLSWSNRILNSSHIVIRPATSASRLCGSRSRFAGPSRSSTRTSRRLRMSYPSNGKSGLPPPGLHGSYPPLTVRIPPPIIHHLPHTYICNSVIASRYLLDAALYMHIHWHAHLAYSRFDLSAHPSLTFALHLAVARPLTISRSLLPRPPVYHALVLFTSHPPSPLPPYVSQRTLRIFTTCRLAYKPTLDLCSYAHSRFLPVACAPPLFPCLAPSAAADVHVDQNLSINFRRFFLFINIGRCVDAP